MNNANRVALLESVIKKYKDKTADGYICNDLMRSTEIQMTPFELFEAFPELLDFRPFGAEKFKPWFGHCKNPDSWGKRIEVLNKLLTKIKNK